MWEMDGKRFLIASVLSIIREIKYVLEQSYKMNGLALDYRRLQLITRREALI